MGVVRGEDWGVIGPVPDDALTACSDGELADLLPGVLWERPDADSLPGPIVALRDGDLCRTLGGRGRARPGGEATW